MAWSSTKTIESMKGKSLKLRELFAKVVNAALEKGMTEQEAIFAGTKAVAIEEKKTAPAKVVAPKVPSHLQTVRDVSGTKPFDLVSKAAEVIPAPAPTIKSAEFDSQGHLVILMSDGKKIVTKGQAINQNIEQNIGVSVNPVFDYVQMNTTANLDDRLPGMLTWNEFEDCLDIVQNDGSTLQTGLETYIQVINNTGNTLENGTTVMFSGVDFGEIPEVQPMRGNSNIEPLYIVGVLTNSLINGQIGRATILGKVRNLDTTGSEVGEIWQRGDLLWVHPTINGKLTKVRPTAPYVAVSVAAVLRTGATDGILLVRPTIFPRLFYSVFSSNQTQQATLINTPHHVHFNIVDIASGVDIADGNKIVTRHAGLYSFDFRLQVTSTNSSQKNMYIWARKNGVDIVDSASILTISGNNESRVPSWSFSVSMQVDDYFELMYAVDNLAILINRPTQQSFCPNIPSATLRVSQINL